MSDRKQQLTKVFQDTQKFYAENEVLAAAVAYGRKNTRLYEADDYPKIPVSMEKCGKIKIAKTRTFEMAMKLHAEFPDK